MLNKFGKPAIYLPIAMITWGIISTATAASQNFAGLLVTRFFLGFVEAAYFVSDDNQYLTKLPLLIILISLDASTS